MYMSIYSDDLETAKPFRKQQHGYMRVCLPELRLSLLRYGSTSALGKGILKMLRHAGLPGPS